MISDDDLGLPPTKPALHSAYDYEVQCLECGHKMQIFGEDDPPEECDNCGGSDLELGDND